MAREEIINELKPLFEEARNKGLWFFCGYQALWFSPNELAAYQNRGSFVWGAINWTLRDPNERLNELEDEVKRVQSELLNFKIKILNA